MARNDELLTYAVIGVVAYYGYTHGWLAKVSEMFNPPKEPAPGQPGAPGAPPAGTSCPPGYVYDAGTGMCIYPIPIDKSGTCSWPKAPSGGTAGLAWSAIRCCWQDHSGVCQYGPDGRSLALAPPYPTGGDGTCGNPSTPSGGAGGLTWLWEKCCWADLSSTCRFGPHGYPVAGA